MATNFITGATGFIGSHLVKALADRGEEVVVLVRDVVPSKWLDEALQDVIKVRGDVRNFNLLKRIMVQYSIEHVYHLAAAAIVSKAVKYPIETFDVNVGGTVCILEACRQANVDKCLVQSTDKVFGEGLNKTASDPLNPVEIYGCSKSCEDMIAQVWSKVYDKPKIIVSRSCNAYGYDRNVRIVSNSIRRCLRGERPILWKWQVGEEPTLRQYIYVEDLADALVYLMNNKDEGTFNIATPDILTPQQVIETILKFFPHLEPQIIEKERPTEILQQSMKMEPFGWGPKYSFERGIELTIKKFREYEY